MSNDNFNELSNAEAERLALIAEECGEVVQAIGKILRHGYESTSPFDPERTTNRTALEKECGDLRAVIAFAAVNGDLDEIEIEHHLRQKTERLLGGECYTHHQYQDAIREVSKGEP